MKPYTVALAANQLLDLKIGGEQFLLDTAPQPLASVEFFGAGNLKRNEALELPVPGDWATPEGGFASIKLTNGAVAQTVRFYIARGRVGRFRVYGEVSVVDGGRARTLGGVAFLGQVGQAAVAAQLSHVQLKNPAASGKRLLVTQILVTASGAAGATVIRHDADLALSNAPPSKDVGGTASVAELRSAASAAPLGVGNNLAHMYLQANTTPPPLVFREPLILRPGRGVIVRLDVVNLVLGATFELTEEDNV